MNDSYNDGLIECTLMVGANELTGLKPTRNKFTHSEPQNTALYQHNILAVLSANVAVFPFSKNVPNYPPEDFKPINLPKPADDTKPQYDRQTSKDNLEFIHDLVVQYNKPNTRDNNFDLNLGVSMNRRTSKFQSRRKSCRQITIDTYKGSFGSISNETIKSFPGTYFNNNLKIYQSYIEPKIEFFPMTDNLGNRSYAFRLEFYRHFQMKTSSSDDNPETVVIEIESVTETDLDSSGYIFVPNFIVFFSKYPYFDLFTDILSQLFCSINNKTTRIIENQIMEYSAILSRIPIMKFNNIQLTFNIDNFKYSIKPINSTFDQVIDWDFTLLFHLLSIDDIIFILLALFQEQKIAFLSNYNNIITLVCETLLVLFQPFTWKHCYLTVVPAHLYELTDAICPFIMGLPIELESRLKSSYDEIIVVNLDKGTVYKPRTYKPASINSDLTNQLKQSFLERDWLTFRTDISNIKTNSMEVLKERNYEKIQIFSNKAMFNFMILMVDLFQEILNNITVEIHNKVVYSNVDKFLNSSQSKNIEFFKSIYQSDNFNCFLDSKLRTSKPDGWDRICNELYPSFLDAYRKQTLKTVKCKRMILDKEIKESFLQIEKSYLTFNLPTNKAERVNYFITVITMLNSSKLNINSLKLKAEIYFQMGDRIKAFETIYQILKIDISALEYSKIKKIISGLDKTTRKTLDQTHFMIFLNETLNFNQDSEVGSEKHSVQQFYAPNIPISKNQFFEICRNANITDFENTADDLFRALTIEQKSSKRHAKMVSPEIFQIFYNTWVQNSTDFSEGEINIDQFLDEVLIHHTPNFIKVDAYGQGRLLLTQMRLLFISSEKSYFEILINFTEETLVKIKIDRRIKGIGRTTDVLEVTTETNFKSSSRVTSKKLVLRFFQDIEIWFNLISEIGYGNKLSYEEKDKVIQDKLTEQCLIYENLELCAKESPFFKRNIYNMAKIMLAFTTSHKEETKLNQPTNYNHRKYIINRLMPSPKQSITIDCALVIPKPILKNFDVWCAISVDQTSFLKCYQIINESIQSFIPKELNLQSRIKVMLHLIGTNKIIFGCSDGTISLLNMNDFTVENFNLAFNPGYHPTCGVIHYESIHSHAIYMAISNGEMIKCQSTSKTIQKVLEIPENQIINFIELYDSETFLIGSSHNVYIITLKGDILSKIVFTNDHTITNRISSLLMLDGNKRLIIGLHRLPVFLEYNISDKKNIICLRKKNLFTNKDFDGTEINNHSESSAKCVGICSIVQIPRGNQFWFFYKDGTVEIRNFHSLEKLETFVSHTGSLILSMVYELHSKNVVLTVGRDDGKINLWNIYPM